jgi:neurotransmitter:Na+ symporter, NSS family
MQSFPKPEAWSSRLGVILAVAGSAVGLGNFLRFPGLAAQYGGGAFMVAYFISLLLIGIPICWVEWTLGRYGGQRGLHSSPGILGYLIRHPSGRYLGVLGVIVPVVIYMYYVYIEAWCLGYSVNFMLGNLNLGEPGTPLSELVPKYGEFFARFVGQNADGSAVGFSVTQVGCFLGFVFLLNFILVYRGLSKGIEWFCKYAMPALVILAVIILVRVLTLGTPDPAKPNQNILNGLGYMWNPTQLVFQERTDAPQVPGGFKWTDREVLVGDEMVATRQAEITASGGTLRIDTRTMWRQLANPLLWLAAAGQIFFSLSVGFGVIITYASYLKNKDDIVLSGLSASSANEFCEVALGGLISIPAAYVFLGAAGIAGMGTFGLGFNVLPLVFSQMPLGNLFGAAFFFLLFLAAVTSSLSMLQPGIAFLEEVLPINRRQSVALLGLVTSLGCIFIVYVSKDMKALGTVDFWVGTLLLFVLATIQVIVFGWVLGVDKGFTEMHRGAEIRLPGFVKFVIKFVSPAYLLAIFIMFALINVVGYDFQTGTFQRAEIITDLIGGPGVEPNQAARMSVALIGAVVLFTLVLVAGSKHRLDRNPNSTKDKP